MKITSTKYNHEKKLNVEQKNSDSIERSLSCSHGPPNVPSLKSWRTNWPLERNSITGLTGKANIT